MRINFLGNVFGLLSFRNLLPRQRDITTFPLHRAFSLTCKFMGTKKKRLHKKTIKPPQDWFGTLTWLPFHCFGTSIWPPWRHVKTLYYRMCYRLRKKTLLNENFIHGVRASQVLITTKVRYIQWTVCYFRAIKRCILINAVVQFYPRFKFSFPLS